MGVGGTGVADGLGALGVGGGGASPAMGMSISICAVTFGFDIAAARTTNIAEPAGASGGTSILIRIGFDSPPSSFTSGGMTSGGSQFGGPSATTANTPFTLPRLRISQTTTFFPDTGRLGTEGVQMSTSRYPTVVVSVIVFVPAGCVSVITVTSWVSAGAVSGTLTVTVIVPVWSAPRESCSGITLVHL